MDLDSTLYPMLAGALWLGAFVEQFVRYLVPAVVVAAGVAWIPALRRLRLQRRSPRLRERARDFLASISFCAIAALVVLPVLYGQLQGATQIYRDAGAYGSVYLVASFFLLLVIHDAYFYWTHRFLHLRAVFGVAHARHHRARTPSVWTAFAFHPLESLVQVGIYPLIAFTVPVHADVFALFLVYTALYSALIHCGHDLFLAGKGRIGRWVYTTVDHDAHHLRGRGGYALYFGWWDLWMRTEVEAKSIPDRTHTPHRRAEPLDASVRAV